MCSVFTNHSGGTRDKSACSAAPLEVWSLEHSVVYSSGAFLFASILTLKGRGVGGRVSRPICLYTSRSYYPLKDYKISLGLYEVQSLSANIKERDQNRAALGASKCSPTGFLTFHSGNDPLGDISCQLQSPTQPLHSTFSTSCPARPKQRSLPWLISGNKPTVMRLSLPPRHVGSIPSSLGSPGTK